MEGPGWVLWALCVVCVVLAGIHVPLVATQKDASGKVPFSYPPSSSPRKPSSSLCASSS